ncbi:unnamed protein product [Gadus morhua 'NCC']
MGKGRIENCCNFHSPPPPSLSEEALLHILLQHNIPPTPNIPPPPPPLTAGDPRLGCTCAGEIRQPESLSLFPPQPYCLSFRKMRMALEWITNENGTALKR